LPSPALMFLGESVGEGGYEQTEEQIRALLAEP
jgi:hypothetical protein